MMEELIARARRREPKAFTELMQMHMQPMYKVARAMLCGDADVADAVQETILGCWEKIGQLKEGKWAFSWQLTGSDEIYTAKVSEKLGDTGALVTGAEVSPISIKAVYDFPAKMVKEEAVDESSGTVYETDMLAEPPLLAGVKLKDGTLVTDTQGGRMGYTDGGKKVYEECFAMGRLLDVDEVESLLFIKKIPEEEKNLGEDDMFAVKIR